LVESLQLDQNGLVQLEPAGCFLSIPAIPSWLKETITVLSLFANDPANVAVSGNQMAGYSVTGAYLP
jgi:hypothetical protein